MSKIYAKAPSGVAERVAHLMKVFHRPLHDAGVKIDLLSVADDDPDCDHALKLRGYPAYVCIKINDIKQRTLGNGDATIIIDESKWLTLSDATKDAIADHELEHLELQINPKNKRIKLDSAGRPKLKMRLHDIEYGHFVSIAERHGQASIEVQQCTQLFLTHKQTLFGFAMDTDLVKRIEDNGAAKLVAKNLVDAVRDAGATMTIHSGDSGTTIR